MSFEIIVKTPKHKDCFEALRLLAQTKYRLGKTKECVDLFKRVLELNPKDYEANIEIAQLYDLSDTKLALVYYENAYRIFINGINERKLKSSEIDDEQTLVPPELMVNLGTLRLDVGKQKEADDAF